MFMVSPRTAAKWAARFRAEGPAGMVDRSARPHHSPTKTPEHLKRQIVALHWRHRLGPVQIAGRLTKFGNIPDGGGHRFVGRQQGKRNQSATSRRTGSWSPDRHPRIGTSYLHTVIDDHSRVAYVEIHADEKATTAIGVLQRATAWFAGHGAVVERVLSDNGSAYRSHAWRDACTDLGITAKRTRPYRPQTNGKIERFHRTLADGWAYARFYASETERRATLPGWLHFYNHHRAHSVESPIVV
jgi:transposase InsO family protein